MGPIIRGKVWKFGDNVNTDEIIPARYLNTSDPVELGWHCMEDISPGFSRKVSKGDIIVAGKNFGCGSSREHAQLAIKGAGIACIIAESFARIFFRNAINMGLLILEIEDMSSTQEGDILEIDLNNSIVKDLTAKKEYAIKPLPGFIQEIIRAGGLLEWVKRYKMPNVNRRSSQYVR